MSVGYRALPPAEADSLHEGCRYPGPVPGNEGIGRRFGEVAEAYERGRPDYPSQIVTWLLPGHPERVVDLGAGTGKLTRALIERAPTVIAVEPDPGMRSVLAQQLPGTSVVDGRGEDIPLRDDFADVVVVGQAWHWFDTSRALPEVARILRPGGFLSLVWNDRAKVDPWLDRLAALLASFGTSPDTESEPVGGAPFGPFETMDFPWTHYLSVDGVVDMVASRSYVIALSREERADLVRQVRELAAQGQDPVTGLVPVAYVTHAFRCRLTA